MGRLAEVGAEAAEARVAEARVAAEPEVPAQLEEGMAVLPEAMAVRQVMVV